jgi:hypothetical protein
LKDQWGNKLYKLWSVVATVAVLFVRCVSFTADPTDVFGWTTIGLEHDVGAKCIGIGMSRCLEITTPFLCSFGNKLLLLQALLSLLVDFGFGAVLHGKSGGNFLELLVFLDH